MTSASTQTTTTATIASFRRFIDDLFRESSFILSRFRQPKMLACQWPGMGTYDQWVVAWNVNRGGSPEPSSRVCGNDSVFPFQFAWPTRLQRVVDLSRDSDAE